MKRTYEQILYKMFGFSHTKEQRGIALAHFMKENKLVLYVKPFQSPCVKDSITKQ